jgi:hypothetical protein
VQIEGATVPYGQKKYEELIESKVRGEDGQRSFAAVLRNRGRRGQTHGSGARTSRPAARAAGQQFRARPATDKIAARRNLAASPPRPRGRLRGRWSFREHHPGFSQD